ncbi:VWA domain-containing protein [Methyloversatilis sp. XJ19-13]|uniref:nitric oxide reductase activation protein NorD n=1 Tax=Methyloversatilis sp. XJ19-13 TaxID=2963430 RepID=UPI00211C2E59|nr:VWA domain-containing protein [Methyloversatilis sp. XJ19-13]MCQ9375993.1 VWA domain-containing protein [Methyloversatilis sp. XJ19-13]
MPVSPDPAGARALSLYLRALWDVAPRLTTLPAANDAARTILGIEGSRPVLHLPALGDAALQRARAAHAAAHLSFGGAPFERARLKPVQRALLEILEDARVEWLAMQALPGLRRLWAPHHVADASWGNGAEALLARLSRCLFDPAHEDGHAWMAKVRGLFFTPHGALALATPAQLRDVASRLGNDVGQMRLRLNPGGWQVEPVDYRDDNHHLWMRDEQLPPSATPLEQELPDANGASGDDDADMSFERPPPQGTPDSDAGDAAASVLQIESSLRTVTYPEWDRLIGRARPDWCTVIEARAPRSDAAAVRAGLERHLARTVRLLQAAAVSDRRPTQGRSKDGDLLHTGALIDAGIALRAGHDPERRLYRDSAARVEVIDVLLLIDTSASTALALPSGRTVLEALREAALLAAAALEATGHRCTVQAFASDTRHRVRVQRVKDREEKACADTVLARAGGLVSAGSTRMGAALRHAMAQLPARSRSLILLLTDGEPHDVDIHDPRYLTEDLAHALADARRAGIAVACLHSAPDGVSSALRRVFPPGSYVALPGSGHLPHLLIRQLQTASGKF